MGSSTSNNIHRVTSSDKMADADIKFQHFDLRVKGEPARLLLAYGGLKYQDDRIVRPWDNMGPWSALKPTMPWGQLPCLNYNGQKICQSMTICRFLAREIGIAGRNSLEMAQVDEIIDVFSDGIDATIKAWNSPNKREGLEQLTSQTFPTVLGQLERRLTQGGGQFMVGNTFSWADLQVFYFCGKDFICPNVLAKYPKLSNLVRRVGQMPNIKKWVESRPANGNPSKDFLIFFKNAYDILASKDIESKL